MAQEPVKPTDDEIELWFKVLTGRVKTGENPLNVEEAEAQAVRRILLDMENEVATAGSLEQDWQKLRFRLRREGLLTQNRRPIAVYWALAATLVLAISVGAMLPQKENAIPEHQLMRGKTTHTRVLRSTDPVAFTAQILEEACTKSAISCKRRKDPSGTIMLDVAVPATVPEVLSDVFDKYGIDLPAGQMVTILLIPSH